MSSLTKHKMLESGVVHLRDASDEPMYADGPDGPDRTKPQRVHVWGPGSKEYAKAEAARTDKQMQKVARTGKWKLSAEESRRYEIEFLADITQEFENIDSDKGLAGRELYLDVYGDQQLSFVRDQVRAFASETANFKAAS